jgi:hypothetical protein
MLLCAMGNNNMTFVTVNSPAVVSSQPVPLQDAVLTGEAIRQLVAHLIHSLQHSSCTGAHMK